MPDHTLDMCFARMLPLGITAEVCACEGDCGKVRPTPIMSTYVGDLQALHKQGLPFL